MWMAAGPNPVCQRRQALSGKPGVGGRLVPTHSSDRVVGLTRRVRARAPGGRSGLAGLVHELLHGVRPSRLPSLAATFVEVNERLFPVFRLPVAALLHKLLELPVSDLAAVDQVI